LTNKRIEAIAEHIQRTISAVNPHDDTRLWTIYTRGFLLGHLASIFERDPILYREFLEHCEKIAQKQHKKIDKNRK
jgi:hypothetical protein